MSTGQGSSGMSGEGNSGSQLLLVVFPEAVSHREEVPTPFLIQLPHVCFLQRCSLLKIDHMQMLDTLSCFSLILGETDPLSHIQL